MFWWGARRGEACNGVKGGCGRRRPDAAWVRDDRVVYLEIDEDSHSDRAVSCELAKIDDTAYTQHINGRTLRAVFIPVPTPMPMMAPRCC